MNDTLTHPASTPAPQPAPVQGTPGRARAGVAALVAVALVAGAVGGAASRELIAAVPGFAPATTNLPVASGVPVAAGTTSGSVAAAAARVAPAVVRITTDQGLGSGFIYDPAGLILTNAHVVANASSITVTLANGRAYTAKVLGADTGFDLAVLKVQASGLPSATLGDSATLRPGDTVIAVGNPYGYDHTVTVGVISALDRPVSEGRGSYFQPMIQTDAAINPGNSGGPLVDLNGNVVGITTLVAAPQGLPAQGLGFAISSATAARIAPQLAASGRVTHSGQPWMGVALRDSAAGVTVAQVVPGSSAARAGVQVGDVITTADGRSVATADDVLQVLVKQKPGDTLTLGVKRSGSPLTLKLVLDEAPAQ